MWNHVGIAALIVDVVGAVLLARGLIFGSQDEYVGAHPGFLSREAVHRSTTTWHTPGT